MNSVLYDSEKAFVYFLLADTQKVAEKTQIQFNEKLHWNYPKRFRKKKLLIEKLIGKIKKQLETKQVRTSGLSLKVTNMSTVRSLHILSTSNEVYKSCFS